jgi:flagellin
MNLISVRANSAGLNLTGTSLSTLANSTTAVTRLNTAVDRIGRYLSTIGGFMSRFEYRKDYIDTTITSLSSAVSSIADSDIGTEEIALTNGTILNKTSMYALTNIYKKQRSAVSLFA